MAENVCHRHSTAFSVMAENNLRQIYMQLDSIVHISTPIPDKLTF
jgi:hypothetical protein